MSVDVETGVASDSQKPPEARPDEEESLEEAAGSMTRGGRYTASTWRRKPTEELEEALRLGDEAAEGSVADLRAAPPFLRSHWLNIRLSSAERHILKELLPAICTPDVDHMTNFFKVMSPELLREWFVGIAPRINVLDPGKALKADIASQMHARILELLPETHRSRFCAPLKVAIDKRLNRTHESVALLFNVVVARGVRVQKELYTYDAFTLI